MDKKEGFVEFPAVRTVRPDDKVSVLPGSIAALQPSMLEKVFPTITKIETSNGSIHFIKDQPNLIAGVVEMNFISPDDLESATETIKGLAFFYDGVIGQFFPLNSIRMIDFSPIDDLKLQESLTHLPAGTFNPAR
jgi:hypothetical protein